MEKDADIGEKMLFHTHEEATKYELMVLRRKMAGLGGRDVRAGTAEVEWNGNAFILLLGTKDSVIRQGKNEAGGT